ncbi:hypothetical protein Y032_0030g2107 [Ancylostoma ceylanicum]|uniref:C2H2-type domain-containing protein n=1 Tax=Ancylostoma ceylanicum TaxID=53326 RepID=A0A016USS8_9BILA|nr:hypothetical protein Y032_0030g2107 [Ancylostoma ceylanicum]
MFLDVHHVDVAAQAKKRAEQESGRKRGAEEDELLAAKLLRSSELGSLDEIKQQNRLNRATALGDPTMNGDLFDSEMADTLICGTCRYVTADYENFKNHRIVGCQRKKEQDEPAYFKCASCDNRFKSAWAILCHLTEFHRMMLYKVEEGQEQQKDNQNNNEQVKKLKADEPPSSAPEPSPVKKPDSTAGTPKPALETWKPAQETPPQPTQLPQQTSSQQQQPQMTQQQQPQQQQQQQDPRNVSYASYASSQPAYATAATLPVYTQAPPPPRPAYPPAGYSQIPGLGSPFTMPPAPEPPQDSVISAAPVRYSNGSSSSSR